MIENLNANVTFPVDLEPVLLGRHGKAWLCDIKAGLAKMGIPAERDATICHWCIEAPWAHPAWHSYSIYAQHLRPIPNSPPVKYYVEGATHELLVWALDPRKDRKSMIKTGVIEGRWMTPPNFAAQFIELTDDLARAKIRGAVQDIVDGKLSPDTDHMQMWADRFGSGMVKQ